MSKNKGQLTVAEAGRRGGLKTTEKGSEFFREIGRRGGKKTASLYRDLLAEFGRRGGRPHRPSLGENVGEEYPAEEGG
jgi:general stress protein YciG